VATIRKPKNRDEAQEALMGKFELTEMQANAILDMRLSALAALEVQRIKDEYEEKLKLIKALEEILGSETKILGIIKTELLDLKKKYPLERRTKIFEQEIGKFKAEDLIPSEQVVVMLTKGNYIKRMPVSAYRSQIRGGRGVVGMETKEEDVIEHLIAADTHNDVFFFTDRGRVFQTKVYEIPASSRLSKGQAIVNILQISPEEKVTAVITLTAKDKENLKYFVMATKKGVVKKSSIDFYKTVRKTGIIAIKLTAGDQLKWVKTTSGTDKIFMASAKGQSIFYNETDIRPMGRSAAGVRGMFLRSDDYLVGIDVVLPSLEEKAGVLAVMENGLGKRTPLAHFKVQLRGGMGIRVAATTSRTGHVVAVHIVYGEDTDVILASKLGQFIRMPLQSIKLLGRDTQGVTLVKLKDGDKVATVTVVTKSAEPILQTSDETSEVQVPTREDRPIQEVPKLVEVDEKQEIQKEVEEIKKDNKDDEASQNNEDNLGEQEDSEKQDDETDVEDAEEIKDEEKLEPTDDSGKEGDNKKEASDNGQQKTENSSIPDWALAHEDTWRKPSVSKLDKNIKVKNYKEDEKPPTPPKPKNPEDPNWWGGGNK
jgi:DNA gyrase subunit A